MPSLRLNDNYIDLGGASIKVYVFNPLFDPDGAEALFSLPLKLPATPPNLEIFKHANRLDNADNTTTYPGAVLEIAGLPFEPNGVLELDGQAFAGDFINVVFKNQVPALLEQLDKININEVLETITLSLGAPEDVFQFAPTIPSPALYRIAIAGVEYAFNPPGGTTVGEICENLAGQINADHPGVAVWTPGAETIRISSANIDELGFTLSMFLNMELLEYVTTAQRNQLLLQCLLDDLATTPSNQLAMPYVHCKGLYKGGVADFRDRANTWVSGDYLENLPVDNALEWKATWLPMVRLPYILDRVMAQIPTYLTHLLGWIEEAAPQSLLLLSNRSLDLVLKNRYDDSEFKYLNGGKSSINLNEHVPGISARSLWNAVREQFALYFKVTGTAVTFTKKKDMLASPPEDWTHLSEPGYSATRRLRRGFSLQYPDLRQEDKKFFTDDGQLAPLTSGEAFNKIPLPVGTTKMATVLDLVTGSTVKCPSIEMLGDGDEGGSGNGPCSLRFLFDHGVQPNSSIQEYIYASHDNLDIDDNPLGALSFDLLADDGIYHQHHKGLLELLADGQPITLPMRLGIADILEVRKWTNARRTIVLEEGQVTAVIKSITVEDGPQGLGVSLVEFVQEK